MECTRGINQFLFTYLPVGNRIFTFSFSLSPEQDGKLFDTSEEFSTEPQIEQFFRDWQDIPGEKFSITTSTLPPGLSPSDFETANLELNSIPEIFYTSTQLPVIRPNNCRAFIEKMAKYAGHVAQWSWCAGSGRLSLTFLSLPFSHLSLFSNRFTLRMGLEKSKASTITFGS